MRAIFANSLDSMLATDDFDESKIKRKAKGTGGGQFASKGGSSSGEAGKPASVASGTAAKAAAAPEVSPEIQAHVADYRKLFPKTWARFQKTVEGMGHASGRVKAADSVVGKLEGRYKGLKLDSLTDMIGMRCTSSNVPEVYQSAEAVKKQFKIIEYDDKMPTGQGFYRALHLIVDSLDKSGNKRAEIQLRTVRQSQVAMWGHDIAYKGKFAKEPAVQEYAKKVSDAYWELDNGRHATLPEPPAILKSNGLAFDPEKDYQDHWVAKEKPEFL